MTALLVLGFFALLWIGATVYAFLRPVRRYPVCKPAVGTRICTRCGREITDDRPCPAVPYFERWN